MRTQDHIANSFEEIADLLSLKNANPFRIRAYRSAANTLRSVAPDLRTLTTPEIHALPNIGDDLTEKIKEYLTKGKITYLLLLRKETPRPLTKFLTLPGVGPALARKFHQHNIKTLSQLEKKARNNELIKLPGIQAKTQANLLHSLTLLKKQKIHRWSYKTAHTQAQKIIQQLRQTSPLQKISLAGSLRRHAPTVHDIDLLATTPHPTRLMHIFTHLPQAEEILSHGTTRSSIRLPSGLQVDLRLVPPESWGAALLYFTGPKAHNITLRRRALSRGLKLNEYGLFKPNQTHPLASKTEKEIYTALDLPYLPPTQRKD